MAVDGGYGPKGYPKFDPNGAPEDWVDLGAVGAYAALVGNRRVGTAAERSLLSASTTAADQAWLGLEFHETDTGLTYRCTGTAPIAWVNVTEPNVNSSFAMSGTPVPARLQVRAFRAEVALGASGVAEVAYPGGAFPNAVLAAIVQIADADGRRGWNANLRNQTVQPLNAVRFIVTDAAGVSVTSGVTVPVVVIAIGL